MSPHIWAQQEEEYWCARRWSQRLTWDVYRCQYFAPLNARQPKTGKVGFANLREGQTLPTAWMSQTGAPSYDQDQALRAVMAIESEKIDWAW